MTEKDRISKLEKRVEDLVSRQEEILKKLESIAQLFGEASTSRDLKCPRCGSQLSVLHPTFPQAHSSWECITCGTQVLPS